MPAPNKLEMHSEAFLHSLMRKQLRLSILSAGSFLVVLLGLPLANYFLPESAAFYDLSVKLWEAAAGKEVATLAGHAAQVNAVAFSRDGKTLATGSFDKSVKLWDVAGRKQKANLVPDDYNPANNEVVLSLDYSPDGKTLATAGAAGTVKLRDVAAEIVQQSNENNRPPTGPPNQPPPQDHALPDRDVDPVT